MRYKCYCDGVDNSNNYFGNLASNGDTPVLPPLEELYGIPNETVAEIIKNFARDNPVERLGSIERVSTRFRNLIDEFVWPSLIREKYTREQIEGSSPKTVGK